MLLFRLRKEIKVDSQSLVLQILLVTSSSGLFFLACCSDFCSSLAETNMIIELLLQPYQSIREYLFQHWLSFIKSLFPKSAIWLRDDDRTYNTCCWGDLCADTLEKIALKLCIGDRTRMAAVCKSWNEILKREDIRTTSEDPWLLMPHNPKNCRDISLYSLSETRVYKFKLNKLLYGGWCCGTSKGWLIMVVFDNDRKPETYLWNPISGSIMRLPSLTTVPCFSKFMEAQAEYKFDNISRFIHRVEVFSVGCGPDKRLVVAAIFNGDNHNQELAFCRPQDKNWRIFLGKYNFRGNTACSDIILHKGILYSLISKKDVEEEEKEKDKNIEETVTTIHLSDCEVKLGFIILDVKRLALQPEPELFPDFMIAKRVLIDAQLAESCNGDLLLTERILDLFVYEEDGNHNGDAESLVCLQTSDFNVKAINLNSDKDCKSLTRLPEDQALFVASGGGSLSRPCQKSGSGNCIYFLADHQILLEGRQPYVNRESGVFYLEGRRFRRDFPSIAIPLQCRSAWFTPTLHP